MTSSSPAFLFLERHAARPGYVDMRGKLSPGSIRDQVIRGTLAIDELVRSGSLGPGRKLLVVGAGVAGVVAAIRGEAAGAQVFLVDQAPMILTLQRANQSRIVSPTLFDWPSTHWEDPSYTGLFSYVEGSPAEFAASLAGAFDRALSRKNSTLHWWPDTKWLGTLPTVGARPPWRANFESTGAGAESPVALDHISFDAVVLCTGIIGESEQGLPWDGKDTVFPFFRFWHDDPYPVGNTVKTGLSEPKLLPHGESTRVAIIGAGDGGLQDFFRFLTNGQTARALLDAVFTAVVPELHKLKTLYRIFDQEHFFLRHELYWQDTSALLQEWNRACREAVAQFYHDKDHGHRIREVLNERISFRDVLVFHEFAYFGRCYAANRFLALLLEQYLQEVGPHGSPFRFNYKALSVACSDHEQSDKPWDHYTGEHQITFETAGDVIRTVNSRAVVVRIGPAPGGFAQKHLLPYWLPDWSPKSRKMPCPVGSRPLIGNRSCQAALWKGFIGTAVLKDAGGRAFAYNPGFAWLIDRKPSKIVGHLPSEYWNGPTGERMEACDRRVRQERTSIVTYDRVRRGSERIAYYTFRFPLEMADKEIGCASLGFHFRQEAVVPLISGPDSAMVPSVAELDRFFESMPCSVAVHDRNNRLLYTNSAFLKTVSPKDQPITAGELLGRTLEEVLITRGIFIRRDEVANTRKAKLWNLGEAGRAGESWYSPPPSEGPLRMVVGFPLLEDSGNMIGLGSIGFSHSILSSLLKADGGVELYEEV